jgi:hypothetical protein
MATPQFDFFPRDFLASTIGWPASARGHYITLLCVAWEQDGLPGDIRRVEAISPGIAGEWPEWEEKFPVGDDGRRRNPRLERERAYRMTKSEAGKAGAEARWGTDGKNGKRMAAAIDTASSSHMANDMAKRCPPSPAPSPSLSPALGEKTHTPREAAADGEECRNPGWAAVAFDEFVATWNATKRAAPWKPLAPPHGWVDAAASPGWLEKAKAAMAQLPNCRFFETPLALTKFLEVGWTDRILAGEFDNARRPVGRGGAEPPKPTTGITSRRWRDDACDNMTDAQYREWRASRRPSTHAASLAADLKAP